jgi:hypothetical protein
METFRIVEIAAGSDGNLYLPVGCWLSFLLHPSDILHTMLSLRHAVLRVVTDASVAVSTCKISRCMNDIADAIGFADVYESVSVLYPLLRRSSGADLSPEDVQDIPERLRNVVYTMPVLFIPELVQELFVVCSAKVGHSKRNSFIRLVRVSIQNHASLWVRSIKKGAPSQDGLQ